MYGLSQDYSLIDHLEPAQLEETFRLRGLAWQARVRDFAAPERWEDPEDADSLHWAILHAGKVVAAARLSLVQTLAETPNAEVYTGVLPDLEGPIGSINRLVVDPDHAGRGLSQCLDRVRLARADTAGAMHVVGRTSAGISRLNALYALGFRTAGAARAYKSGPLRQMETLLETPDLVLIRSRTEH
jgi:GNAT superfamily N-acetyltransferase